jgi:hypothetical protein
MVYLKGLGIVIVVIGARSPLECCGPCGTMGERRAETGESRMSANTPRRVIVCPLWNEHDRRFRAVTILHGHGTVAEVDEMSWWRIL